MTWFEATSEWPTTLERLKTRFPHLDRTEFSEPPSDRRYLERHLAERHDLTPFEAEQELGDWLAMESMARNHSATSIG